MTTKPRQRNLALLWALLGLMLIPLAMSNPVSAHEDHKKKAATQVVQPVPATSPSTVGAPADTGHEHVTGAMDDMGGMDVEMDRSKMPFFERLFDWFGRLHPAIVHFPIAFFPAALFTALVGRRRPAFAAPVQFLVVAGGIFAPIAAVAGWSAGLTADPEPVLSYHRWLGVAVGAVGAALAVWAWRRPWEDRGAGMILALTAMTIAIAAQGFLGAAVTHGMEHLLF